MFSRSVLALTLLAISVPAFAQTIEMARVNTESKSYIMKVYVQAEPGNPHGSGTGSAQLIKNAAGELRVLTNNHVVGLASKVMIQFHGEFAEEVAVLGTDPRADLALLAAPKNLPSYAKPIQFGKTPVRIGDMVYAIGYPLTAYNITFGWVTSYATPPIGIRAMTHQGPLTRGNSGGALVRLNERGEPELVGINTAISNDDGNLSYFVPIEVAERLLRKLESGVVVHAMMGLGLVDTTSVNPYEYPRITGSPYPPRRKGILISHVGSGSSAERAGVKSGDMIIHCEALVTSVWKQLPISNSSEFSDEVFFNIDPGTRGRLTVMRGDKELTFEIEFAAAPRV
jgi:serine protease Do